MSLPQVRLIYSLMHLFESIILQSTQSIHQNFHKVVVHMSIIDQWNQNGYL